MDVFGSECDIGNLTRDFDHGSAGDILSVLNRTTGFDEPSARSVRRKLDLILVGSQHIEPGESQQCTGWHVCTELIEIRESDVIACKGIFTVSVVEDFVATAVQYSPSAERDIRDRISLTVNETSRHSGGAYVRRQTEGRHIQNDL